VTPPILGLHHVTATVDAAQDDLDFSLGGLGLRLVKKTVNFDNHDVYHFYYGTERGLPGTLWTTFPYRGYGVRPGVQGVGQVTVTAFSVPAGSLPAWQARLHARGVRVREAAPRFGQEALLVADASGLAFELVACDGDERRPWTGSGADDTLAIRGLHSVTLTVRTAGPTVDLLTGLLGFSVVDRTARRVRVGVNGAGPGRFIDIVEQPDAPAAVNGLGTVHHVAMATATADDQLRLREELLARGLRVTEVRDRCYFQSIYFREPGGVLFEIATIEPGFLVDEPLADLGRGLKLPPWEEPHRPRIEAALPPVRTSGIAVGA
jgi:glyoxalase family protein